MNKEACWLKLQEIMKQTSQPDMDWSTVTDATVIASIGFDSLAILDLIYDIQQGFGLDFNPEEMVQVRTVGELIDFIVEKAEGASASPASGDQS